MGSNARWQMKENLSNLALRVAYEPTRDASRTILVGMLECDPEMRWGVCETWLAPARSTRTMLDDVVDLSVVYGELAFDEERVRFRLELVPQLLLVFPDLANLALPSAKRLMGTCAGWSPCDFASLHRPGARVADDVSDARMYVESAAVGMSARRYQTLGPLTPGIAAMASPRWLELSSGQWRPSQHADDASNAYDEFVRAGLGASWRLIRGVRELEPPPRWRPLPSTVARSPDPDLLQQLRYGIGEVAVDYDDVDLPTSFRASGISLISWRPWFLHLSGAVLRWAALDDAAFLECSLEAVDFTGASLARADLHQTIASHARFVSADLADARIRECRFVDTSFAGVRLLGVCAESTEFVECDFSDCQVDDVTLSGSKFVGCVMEERFRELARRSGAIVL